MGNATTGTVKLTKEPLRGDGSNGASKCACGCGGYPKMATSRYCQGHDGRLKRKLIAHVCGTDADKSTRAKAALVKLGWYTTQTVNEIGLRKAAVQIDSDLI